MIKRRYPQGFAKAFNVTYDDGVLQDVRFVQLLNKYGLKGTFNLNSALMKSEFEWTHESGSIVKRLPQSIVVDLYREHEVASHTLTHPYMSNLSKGDIMYELIGDKANLQTIFQKRITGFAVPFDYYSDLIEQCVKESGFEYARISEESHSYAPCEAYYRWKAGIFHLSSDLDAYIEGFLNTDEELAVCQIVGHTYDLDVENMWEKMEDIFAKISTDKTILPMTHIELVRYLRAIRSATIKDNMIINNSDIDLWFEINGSIKQLHPKEVMKF